MRIRPYAPSDLDALYDICLRTGDNGRDASNRFADPRLLGEVYAAPYAAHDPGLVSVLVTDDERVVGYVIGCRDTLAFEDWCEREWWPELRARHLLPDPADESPDAGLVRQIHDRSVEVRPWLVDPASHPAHLHIDLLPEAQGGGWGRRLVERLVDQLVALDVPGLHLGVGSENTGAIAFYERLGLAPLDGPDDALTLGRHLPVRDGVGSAEGRAG
ncbi:GNAT family N-acetyltransferase [Oerskovia sp. Root918]|uniref:GNAT family N-acetyltransferase n=1 Tax=Oerskovia sp. Root918 TaxID=1736607 RepID=UPI0009EC3ACA|nr:GNAT family N-acetyltransferase [Oerskovia sp. Root918]